MSSEEPNRNSKPLVVVTGATGAQGGSVARFLLEDGGFRVRGVTRDVASVRAKELAARGAEVVYGNLDDPLSLQKAFEGAHGVFGLTNYWEVLSGEKEAAQGRALVDAARASGVAHFVWSTLEHTGDLHIEHLDAKHVVDQYLKQSGVPRTSLYTTFYYENFLNLLTITPAKDAAGTGTGAPVANWPLLWSDGPLGGYSVADTGAYALEAFKHPETWLDNDLRIQADIFTPRELVNLIRVESGKDVVLVETSRAAFEALGGVKETYELWANMKWFYNSNGNPGRDMDLTARIYPNRQTVRDFVKVNISKLIPA